MKKKRKKMLKLTAGKDYPYNGMALTLDPSQIGTHKSGWTIEGVVHEDYYEWVNDFHAHHRRYGTVRGNFESMVFATNRKAFNHFCKNHPPVPWDYGDI